MQMQPRVAGVFCRLFALLAPIGISFLTGCGGGSSSGPSNPVTPPTTFTISGTVSGLTGTGLVLQENGANNLAVSGNGPVTFSASLAAQATYSVTVGTQPGAQICSVQNGYGTVATANVTNVTVSCIVPPTGGSGALTSAGGTVTTAAAIVTAPPGASLTSQNVTIATVAPPAGLPPSLASVGAAVDISVDSAGALNAPLLVTLPYDPTGLADENELAVVHYDTTKMVYEPVTILNHDTSAHTFQIESRVFSPFVIVSFANSLLDASHTVTNFTPANNGWNIDNFGNYFTPGGNCLGMSAYAVWYFDNSVAPQLNGAYSAAGNPSIAQLVAVRAQLAQSQYWSQTSTTYLNQLGSAATGALMKMYLDTFNQPLILSLGVDGQPKHAGVLYGYNSSGFLFYDTNIMNASQTLTFDGTNFGTYSLFNEFTYDTLPSLGRNTDFAGLTAQAVAGFTSSSLITVTAPTAGEQIAAHSADLTGTLSSSLNPAATVVAYVKGVQQTVMTSNGSFSATIPIGNGDNPVILLAGEFASDQSNWYPNAATLIFDVTGTLPPTTLLATLTWDQNNTDADLYVTEPAPSSQTAWWGNLQTTNLLTLDFDNTTGYGPEHTTLTTTGANPGTALPGLYTITVHYYSDHGTGQTITGEVTIVVNEGMSNQAQGSQLFSLDTSNDNNYAPGSTGPDWAAIGTVDLVHGTITFAPGGSQPQMAPPGNQLRSYPYNGKKPSAQH
jgi:uncharacterized protein YfaP (DUF2135 family)